MRRATTLATGIGLLLGFLLLAAAFITASAGATAGTSAQQTATPPPPTATPTPRAGTLNISPSTAPAGTELTIAGTGFSPNALLVIIIEDASGANWAYGQPSVDESGAFSGHLDTAGYLPGPYSVSVASLPDIGTLARANFTLTGAPAPPPTGSGGYLPGLPNTGTGATATNSSWIPWLLGGAAIMGLLALGGFALRRRLA